MDNVFANLPPEVLAELIGLGSLDDESAELQQQVAQAEALRQGGGVQHTTPLGAAFGAGADIINAINSRRQMEELRTKQADVRGRRESGRSKFADVLRNMGQPQNVGVQPGTQGPRLMDSQLQFNAPFGFGGGSSW